MTPRFMADENIPFRIVTGLRTAGYDVLSVKDVAHVGIRNNELAELSIRLDRIIITRDADFTRLTKPLLNITGLRTAGYDVLSVKVWRMLAYGTMS